LSRGSGRRRFLAGAAAAAAGACARAGSRSGAPAGVSLLVPASERQVWGPLAEDFEASGGGRVRLVEGPNSTDLRENLYTAALLARDSSFDVVLMDVTWTPKFAAAGWLRPLDGSFDHDELAAFLPQALDAGRYREHLYRLPTRTDVGVLYYRRDWLEEAGHEPPRTFADLERTARALQDPPHRWGFVWQGSQYEGLICAFLEVLRGHGGFWVSGETGEVGLERPRIFQEGRAVFLRNWPYVWRLAQAEGSPLAGRVGVQAVVSESGAPGAGSLGGWGLGVSRYSRDPEAAIAFIRHAVSLPGQRTLCRTSGYVPSRREAFEDGLLLEANPFLATLRPIHDSAAPRPALPRYALASDILQRRVSAALAGLATTREALAAAARETRLLLGDG
jgi:multiple sugar transport system substrate-binding protein